MNYYYYRKYGCSNVVKTAILQASKNAHAEVMEASGERVAFEFAMGGDFGSTSLYTPINMDWVEGNITEYLPNEEIQKKIVAIDEQVFTETMRRELTEFEVWWNKIFNHERKFLMV